MKWILAFHIIFMVAWFAGLFYLPRLFVYHSLSADTISNERFKLMEQRLYYSIMTPAAILTIFFGLWVMSYNWAWYWQQPWMHLKLSLVLLLGLYHVYCGTLVWNFRKDRKILSAAFYRWFNEIPTVFLLIIVILAVVKPVF